MSQSVHAACRHVLGTADAKAKAAAALEVAAQFASGNLDVAIDAAALTDWPMRPARPERPQLVAPRFVKRRSLVVEKGRISLLHAVAHIELNAIDLAFDIIGRFARDEAVLADPTQFATDWIKVGSEEAKHFLLLSERLQSYGAAYGDFPAHDGLWKAAESTSSDLAARLVLAPMVLEARGLDVTPPMIEGLAKAGDHGSANALQIIHDEEVGHVAAGQRWFSRVCAQRQIDPSVTFHLLVQTYYPGGLKGPFNTAARGAAGLSSDWYAPLAQ